MLNAILDSAKTFANMPSVLILSSMIGGQFLRDQFGVRLLPDYGRYDDVLAALATATAIMALIPSSALPAQLRRFDLVDY